MKRLIPWLLLTVALILLPVGLALAGSDRSPSKDTTCANGGACADNFGIQSTGSNTPSPCSNGQLGYIGWDLSGVVGTITTAELTLTTYSVSGAPAAPNAVEFQLVEPNSQSWTEDGTDPGLTANVLATASSVLSNGTSAQTVTFGGSGNPTDAATLGAYLENLKASGAATVGIRISGGCTLNTSVAFNDSENTGGQSGDTEPDLLLFGPTAVTVQSFRPGDAGNLGLMAAGLLLLVLAGTVFVVRTRRS